MGTLFITSIKMDSLLFVTFLGLLSGSLAANVERQKRESEPWFPEPMPDPPCAHRPMHQATKDMQSFGAQPFPDVKDVDHCIIMCENDEQCLALDWNNGPEPFYNTQCWLHYLQEDVNKKHRNIKVDHYEKNMDGKC